MRVPRGWRAPVTRDSGLGRGMRSKERVTDWVLGLAIAVAAVRVRFPSGRY